jgi:ion channel
VITASALIQIREDLIPFAVLGIGGVMLVIIMIVHGFGIDRIVARYKRKAENLRTRNSHPKLAVFVFSGTILLLLFLHIAEICLWGLVFRLGGLIPNFHEAVYFSANTYTTLGMGPMSLPHAWHELSPIVAISGLFAFAWTTSELFNIVGYQRDLVSELSAKRQRRIASEQS